MSLMSGCPRAHVASGSRSERGVPPRRRSRPARGRGAAAAAGARSVRGIRNAFMSCACEACMATPAALNRRRPAPTYTATRSLPRCCCPPRLLPLPHSAAPQDSKMWPFFNVASVSPNSSLVSSLPQASCGTCLEVRCMENNTKAGPRRRRVAGVGAGEGSPWPCAWQEGPELHVPPKAPLEQAVLPPLPHASYHGNMAYILPALRCAERRSAQAPM